MKIYLSTVLLVLSASVSPVVSASDMPGISYNMNDGRTRISIGPTYTGSRNVGFGIGISVSNGANGAPSHLIKFPKGKPKNPETPTAQPSTIPAKAATSDFELQQFITELERYKDNPQKAEELIAVGARNGNSLAQYLLAAVAYNSGNYLLAKEMAEKSANQGVANSQFLLSRMYITGVGVKQGIPTDLKAGKYWLQKAAEQGYEPAIKAWNELKGIL